MTTSTLRLTQYAHGGGCACTIPGAPVIGELAPRRDSVVVVRS